MRVIMTKKEVAEAMAKFLADTFGSPIESDDIKFERYGFESDFMVWERIDRPDNNTEDAKDD